MSDFVPPIPIIGRTTLEDIVNVQPIELPQGFTFDLSVSSSVPPSADYRTETEKYLERIGTNDE